MTTRLQVSELAERARTARDAGSNDVSTVGNDVIASGASALAYRYKRREVVNGANDVREIMIVCGTRPAIIKLAPVYHALAKEKWARVTGFTRGSTPRWLPRCSRASISNPTSLSARGHEPVRVLPGLP